MQEDEHDVKLLPQYVAPIVMKEKGELGMNEWHGIKYPQKPQICQSVIKGLTCNRKFCDRMHDVDEYLKIKEAPLDIPCPFMAHYGFCDAKWNCIYKHENNEFELPDKKERPAYINNVPFKLIKDFQPTGKKHEKFDFKGKLFLAPMCTVGTMPFRRWCKDFECDVTCSEMIFARDLLNCQAPEIAKLRRHISEDKFGIQLTGNAFELKKSVEILSGLCEFEYIELNAACPQDVAVKRKCGFQIAQENKIRNSVEHMLQGALLSSASISLKTRIGDFQGDSRLQQLVSKDIPKSLNNITLHGRTAKQRYQRSADWQKLQEFQELKQENHQQLNFTANGDLFNIDTFKQFQDNGVADSFMIGRGALVKPWIFKEFKHGQELDPSSSERFEWLKNFAWYCTEYFGSDRIGNEKAREQFLENYVYLCRYVPTGLLAAKQEINQRNIAFIGRDELETLMGSQSPADWVKITEMLFGPVPEGFQYQPKHRSKGKVDNRE
ncbi:Dihydrouridine_synthase [Hexamita inflata]|uniref:tRNA-dihydrouridine(47) synthase [NAD(P)(+)] n=1 Tax=Hexamita inflata TaxID=28002 RepID=A0AA86TAS8_9EUKA|nr:Dihydrouridine synthase [Hexamita inflata]